MSVYVICNWPYINSLFLHTGITLNLFLGVRKTFPEIWNSLWNVSIWWKKRKISVISYEGTKAAARNCPFTDAKLPGLFIKTKLIAQAEFKKWEINFKRTVRFIKRFDAEQARLRGIGKIRSLPHIGGRKSQGAIEKPWQMADNFILWGELYSHLLLGSVKCSSLDKFQFPLKVNSLRTVKGVRDVFTNMSMSPCTNCFDS